VSRNYTFPINNIRSIRGSNTHRSLLSVRFLVASLDEVGGIFDEF